MLSSIPQPLSSVAAGAAQPLVAGLDSAAPSTGPLQGRRSGAVTTTTRHPDAFVAMATGRGALPASGSASPRRARATGAGYAASASAAVKSSKATKTAAKASATAKKTASAKTTSNSAAKKAGPLAFLDDKSLSVEEKLMRLVAYLNAKWDKDLEKKMKEIGGGQATGASASSSSAAAKTSSSSSKKKTGVLGSVASVVKAVSKFVPQVGIAAEALKNPAVRAALGKVGVPVLAAAASALGQPGLGSLLMKYGPAVLDAAAGIASALEPSIGAGASGGSGGTSTSASGGSSSAASQGAMSDGQLQLKMMEMQRIQQKQKEMFSLVSNMLHAGHELRMNVIQNLR